MGRVAREVDELFEFFVAIRKLTPSVDAAAEGGRCFGSPPYYNRAGALPNYTIKFSSGLTAENLATLCEMPQWLNETYVLNLFELAKSRGLGRVDCDALRAFSDHNDQCRCRQCIVVLLDGLRNRFAHVGGIYEEGGSFCVREGKPTDDLLRVKLEALYPGTRQSGGPGSCAFALPIDKVVKPLTDDVKRLLEEATTSAPGKR